MSRTGYTQCAGKPVSSIRLHIRERGSDRWQAFDSVRDAARYALDLDGVMPQRLAFPLAIWDGDCIVWGSATAAPRLQPSRPGTLRQLARQ